MDGAGNIASSKLSGDTVSKISKTKYTKNKRNTVTVYIIKKKIRNKDK
jgi:hypothetical protein